jgi:hypothetical protein
MVSGRRSRSELDLSKIDWSVVDATTDAEITLQSETDAGLHRRGIADGGSADQCGGR